MSDDDVLKHIPYLESKAADLDSQGEHEVAVQVREWAEMYRAEATRRGLGNKIE